MRDSRPQSLESLFNTLSDRNKSPLHDIQQRTIALLKLNRIIKGSLPAQLHPWCRIANYRQDHLILETANATWLMRLRYEQPTLLLALRAQILPSLASIDIRINPALAAKGNETISEKNNLRAESGSSGMPPRQLSKQSAETIRNLASHSTGKIKKILERLALLTGEDTSKTSQQEK
ncbi:MAG: DUF721 domain-containing protein [Candidatus Malihini olakiniferum]